MNWEVAGICGEGSPLEIGGIDVWQEVWHDLNIEKFKAPHPSYPSQLHTMTPCYIKKGDTKIIFATTEVSASVYSFYIPKKSYLNKLTQWLNLN